MRKLLKNNKHIFLIIALIETVFVSNSFSQDDTSAGLREERQVLEQLNILKRNNIKEEPSTEIAPQKNAMPTQVIAPTKTMTPTPTLYLVKREPTKAISKVKAPNHLINAPTTNNIEATLDTQNNDIKKENLAPQKNTLAPFPQKDIAVVVQTPSQVVNNCIKENKQLELANQKIQELSRELENKKRQLILVETEVERLSEVIEKRNRAQLAGGGTTSNTVNQAPPSQHVQKQIVIPTKKPYDDLEAEKADMPIAVVIVNKANLRAGPSLKDSPLLEVSKGTRLVVETRQGSWYRVMAPNGKRAWVSSDVVNFGANSSARPSFTTRIKGYSQDAEDRTESILR